MKKLLVTAISLFCILIFIGTSFGSPFVVTAPQDEALVTGYIVTLDATPTNVTPQVLGDGTVRCVYDLNGISEGNHSLSIKATNIWGESNDIPFSFTKALPPDPSSIQLEK
jgi:hypothetical protein